MKHLSLRRILALALSICLAVTLLTAFSPTRSAHAATTKATVCQTLPYTPGHFILYASQRKQWTTCAGNTMDLNMQTDGNFVLYLNGQPIWATNTSWDGPGLYAEFQSDGNLVVYDSVAGASAHVWASDTSGKHAASLKLQSDGNMVIYNTSGQAIWSSHTYGH